MPSYVDVFTGDIVEPRDVSYRSITLSSDLTLDWPFFGQTATDVAPRILDVSANSGGLSIIMPPANEAGVGSDILFNNVGSNTFTVKDSAGATLGTVTAGQQKYLYLRDNSTAAGLWRIFTFGTGTSSADASALAGSGLLASGGTLNINLPISDISSSPYTLLSSDRGKTLRWNGGALTLNMLATDTAGNGFVFGLRNEGTGNITVTPAGLNTVNEAATVTVFPLESCLWVSNGLAGASGEWVSIGLERASDVALLSGRPTGQTLNGGTGASENLTLRSTSHATKGEVRLADTGGNIIIGGSTAAAEVRLMEPSGSGTSFTALKVQAQSADITYILPAAVGSLGQVLSDTDGAGTLAWRHTVQLGTEQAGSGTTIDFTGIPAWARHIQVSFVGLSSNGTSNYLLQLGDSGGIETAGYNGVTGGADGSAVAQTLHSGTTGHILTVSPAAAGNYSGSVLLSLEDASDFTWTIRGNIARNDSATLYFLAGHKALSAALDRLRITAANGTDTFDAGSINISYW